MADGKVIIDTELDTSDAETRAGKLGSSLKSGLGTAASVAIKGTAVAVGAVGTAIGGLAASSLKAYASYEQLVGGVDTLFKDSSKKVQEYANKAYQTAQMSANDYMETVTSFSASLLQGLGGDTEKAADKADKAIIDMSDNANKMGTDMQMIQNAYQGFAKQNYTMLDNLKLGYGGTKSEMARLVKDSGILGKAGEDLTAKNLDQKVSFDQIVDAIHVVQSEMGIAGTSAKEASTTIEGSVNTMKSSWDNLVSGMAQGDANIDELVGQFITSTETVIQNVIPVFSQIFSGMATAMDSLLPQLMEKIPILFETILPLFVQNVSSVIAQISAMAQSALPQIISGLTTGLQSILQLAPTLLTIISQLITTVFNAISSAIPQLIPILVQGAMSAIEGLLSVLPSIRDAGINLILSLADGVVNAIPGFISKAPKLIVSFVNFLLESSPKLIVAGGKLILKLAVGLIKNLPALIKSIPKIIVGIVEALAKNAVKLVKAGAEMIPKLWDGVKKLLPKIPGYALDLWKAINEALGDAFTGIVDIGGNLIKGLWEGIKDMAKWIKDKIKGFGEDVLNGLKDFFGIHSPSRLMKDEVGVWLARGIWEGFDDENPLKTIESDLKSNMKSLNATASGSFVSTIKGLSINYDELGESLTSALQNSKLSIKIGQREFGRVVREVV